jgi:hypothetical protein
MKRHLVFIAAFIAVQVVLVALVNFRVDPLLLYRHSGGGGELLSRIEQFPNMRMYKPYHVSGFRPDAAIIGTSRSGTLRFAPRSGGNIAGYNLSMPGLTMHEMLGMVKHAHAQRTLRRLIIGLDFLALVSSRPVSRPGFEAARLREPGDRPLSSALLLQRISDARETLVSVGMLRQSLRAIRQPANLPRFYFADGSWRQVGTRLSGEAGYVYNARFGMNLSNLPHFRTDENMEILEELLDFCHSNGIDTRLFFTPVHVFFIDIWHRLARDNLWREAHAEVLEANRRAAGRHRGQPFEVVGFQAEREVVTETIEPTGKGAGSWFSDGLHFGERLAGKIMASMQESPGSFGEVLDEDTLDRYLEQSDAARRAFLRDNHKQVMKLYNKIEFITAPRPASRSGRGSE